MARGLLRHGQRQRLAILSDKHAIESIAGALNAHGAVRLATLVILHQHEQIGIRIVRAAQCDGASAISGVFVRAIHDQLTLLIHPILEKEIELTAQGVDPVLPVDVALNHPVIELAYASRSRRRLGRSGGLTLG